MNKYMQLAIREAEEGISKAHGGPFGAVIVKDGKIISKAHNSVLLNNDPTAHGEVLAIRYACANLNTIDLSGATLYTTGQPCPMCLGAIMWANIDKVYYGCTIEENSKIGFRDEAFYENISSFDQNNKNKLIQIDHNECLNLFKKYNLIQDKTIY